jgi:hypothetical protein
MFGALLATSCQTTLRALYVLDQVVAQHKLSAALEVFQQWQMLVELLMRIF